MSAPNEITCSCQHCNGHIKFDVNYLRPGESKQIECPHCHLETIIYRPSGSAVRPSAAPSKPTSKITKSSKIELLLFELTRFPMIAGAILVLLAFMVVAFLIIQTRTPEKIPPLPQISYEMVAPLPETPAAPVANKAFVPQGAKMAKKDSFPQPVIDFLLTHQGFKLKEWLDELTPEQRRAFLKNLASVLVTAKSDNLSNEDAEKVVKDFGDAWINKLKRDTTARTERMIEKQRQFSLLTTVAFELFSSLMILSLVLVLLAIERNTRANGKPKEAP